MSGEISKEEWDKEQKAKKSAELSRLNNIERAAKKYLDNPTPENKKLLKKAIYPPDKRKWNGQMWDWK